MTDRGKAARTLLRGERGPCGVGLTNSRVRPSGRIAGALNFACTATGQSLPTGTGGRIFEIAMRRKDKRPARCARSSEQWSRDVERPSWCLHDRKLFLVFFFKVFFFRQEKKTCVFFRLTELGVQRSSTFVAPPVGPRI